MIRYWPIPVLVLAAILARLSFYTVDAAEYAYVTILGQHVATFDGASGDSGAGLHAGWPWPIQMIQRLDRRLQLLDLPAAELLTHDPEGKTIDKMLLVESYAYWRIADRESVDLFIRRIGSADRARAILGPRITSQLGAAIGQMRMDDLVSVEPGKIAGKTRVDETLASLNSRLLDALKASLREEYGIELVDLRLRRFSHPKNVSESIYARIRSERERKVKLYQGEGELQASKIESKAEEDVRGMIAQAKAEEEKLRGHADAEAMRIRNEAYAKDPEFYAFLKQMDQLQNVLGDSKTMLLLSTQRSVFNLLQQAPKTQIPEKKESK